MKWLVLCLLLIGCAEGTWWHPHALKAAQQLCQATDLHVLIQNEQQKQLLTKFCASVGWPVAANQMEPIQ